MNPLIETFLWAIVFVGLVVVSGFFSGIGAALVAVNRYRLRHGHSNNAERSSRRVAALFDDAQEVLGVSLIGTAIANIAALVALLLSLCAWFRVQERPLDWETAALALLVGIPVLLIFGEVAPRRLFRERADRVLSPLYGPMRLSLAVLGPLARAGIALAEKIGPREEAAAGLGWLAHSEQRQSLLEIEEDLAAGPSEPDSSESRMIHGVFDLQKTRVREVMRPLVDLVAIRLPANCGGVRDLARATGYSRFPVYRDRITNLLGYVEIYDILRADPPDGQSVERYVRRAFYVPESKRLDDLLQELLDGHDKVAIVVDEYGGCSGWVTREDLLEEIVGEIEDEFDTGSEPIRKIDERTYLVSATMDIDDLNEELGLRVPSRESDTLGGFVYDRLGRIPKVGEAFDDDGVHYEVTDMDERRIVTVRITLPALDSCNARNK